MRPLLGGGSGYGARGKQSQREKFITHMLQIIISLLFGGLIGWGIAWHFYRKSTADLNKVISKLPEDIAKKIYADPRDKLSIKELNGLIMARVTNRKKRGLLSFVACPKCGSTNIEQDSRPEVDYDEGGATLAFYWDSIKCKDCGWHDEEMYTDKEAPGPGLEGRGPRVNKMRRPCNSKKTQLGFWHIKLEEVFMKVFVVLVAIIFALGGSLLAYDNSPANMLIFPEVIWAQAMGGGTWVSELQITHMAAHDGLWFKFCCGGGQVRISCIMKSYAQYTSLKFSNILATLQSLDSAFTYYGRVGCLMVSTGGGLIQGAVRTFNGNYSKTFQGLTAMPSNYARDGEPMMIQNLTNNATYRTSVGCFINDVALVNFVIYDADGLIVGSPFSKFFDFDDFQSFNPFVEAGVPPGEPHDNCWLRITLNGTLGLGLFCYGATANNYTNDPAAHIAVHFQ